MNVNLNLSGLESFFRKYGSYFVLVYEALKNTGVVHNAAGTTAENAVLTAVAGLIAAIEHKNSKSTPAA